MSRATFGAPGKIMAFSAVVETGTGLVLMIDPVLVVSLLLGESISGVALLLGRCFGVALLALGVACWPARSTEAGWPAFRAMLIYNLLIALYLAYLGTAGNLQGLLLWPAVALHAAVALALLWTRRGRARG
jgi:hypothetical protein